MGLQGSLHVTTRLWCISKMQRTQARSGTSSTSGLPKAVCGRGSARWVERSSLPIVVEQFHRPCCPNDRHVGFGPCRRVYPRSPCARGGSVRDRAFTDVAECAQVRVLCSYVTEDSSVSLQLPADSSRCRTSRTLSRTPRPA